MAIKNAKDYSLTFENQDKSFQVLGFDSLDIIEIIQSIEHEFSTEIPDEISDGLDTFNKIVNYIRIQKPSPFFFKEKEFRMQRDYSCKCKMENHLDQLFICACALFIGLKIYCIYTMLT